MNWRFPLNHQYFSWSILWSNPKESSIQPDSCRFLMKQPIWRFLLNHQHFSWSILLSNQKELTIQEDFVVSRGIYNIPFESPIFLAIISMVDSRGIAFFPSRATKYSNWIDHFHGNRHFPWQATIFPQLQLFSIGNRQFNRILVDSSWNNRFGDSFWITNISLDQFCCRIKRNWQFKRILWFHEESTIFPLNHQYFLR